MYSCRLAISNCVASAKFGINDRWMRTLDVDLVQLALVLLDLAVQEVRGEVFLELLSYSDIMNTPVKNGP